MMMKKIGFAIFTICAAVIILTGCERYQFRVSEQKPAGAEIQTPPEPLYLSFADVERTQLDTASKSSLRDFAIRANASEMDEKISIFSNANGGVAAADYLSKLGYKKYTLLTAYKGSTDSAETIAFVSGYRYSKPDAHLVSYEALQKMERENVAVVLQPAPAAAVEKVAAARGLVQEKAPDIIKLNKSKTDIWIIVATAILLWMIVVFMRSFRMRRARMIWGLLAILLPGYSVAAPDNDNALETFRSIEESAAREQMINNATLKSQAVDTQSSKKTDEKTIITLHKISISASDILSNEFLSALRDKYLNRPLTASEVQGIAAEINDQYSAMGYPAARAFLPRQDITSGTLQVSLIEGRVGAVSYQGNRWTADDYLDRFFYLPSGENVLMPAIETQVLNFNAHNDIKSRITLSPGEKYGTTDVNIVLDEPNLLSFTAFADNGGQKETGLTRYGISGSMNSLTGFRDVLTIGALGAEGMSSWYALFEMPDPWLAVRWGVGYDHSDTQIVAGALNTLSVKGDYDNVYLYAKKPFFVRRNSVSHLNVNIANKQGSSRIADFLTQTNNVSVLTISADNTWTRPGFSLFNSLAVSQGVSMLGGEADFTSVAYTGEVQQQIISHLALNFKLRLFYADAYDDQVVPSSEKMQIGGANSVRGYTESLALTDSGATGSLELRYNISRWLPTWARTGALVFAFLDYGQIFDDNSFVNIERDAPKNLASVGGGIRASITDYVGGSLTGSHTLITNIVAPRKESKFMFFVSAMF